MDPATRVGRPTDISHESAPNHIFEKITKVRYEVSAKSDYSYKTDFGIWRENQDLERQNNARSQPTLESTPIGAKMSDPKTLTLPTDLSKRKETA